LAVTPVTTLENAMDRRIRRLRRWFLALGLGIATAVSLAPVWAQDNPCGGVEYPFPYTDVASVGAAFCPGIMEAYVTGVSKGTTPTAFSPNNTVIRSEMTTFLQRTLDQSLTRSNKRTVLKQLWQTNIGAQGITVSGFPVFCAADGQYIWVASFGTVDKIEASTGTLLSTWTGATKSWAIFPIPGIVLVADNGTPGNLFAIDPTVPPGALSGGIALPGGPSSIAYDGSNVWIADFSGSVSILAVNSLSLTNPTAGFTQPVGLVYDGTNMWVTDNGAGKLFELDATGAIIDTVTVGSGPEQPTFDGENIWVPNYSDNSISVVQASTHKVIATIASDGTNLLSGPEQASFDGERILVTNNTGNSVTIFKAADLSFIANLSTGTSSPYGVCSDGVNFWVTVFDSHNLLRF
jgi:YVTN family beta-propeller protein